MIKNFRIFFAFSLLLFLTPLQIYTYEDKFEKWLSRTTEKLDEKGRVIPTALGNIQVVIKGHGPVVLSLYGGFGGWDHGFFYAALGAILTTETETVDYTTYLLHISLKEDYYSAAVQFLPADTSLTGISLKERNYYVLHHSSQYNFLRKMLKATIPISPRLLGTLNDFLGVSYWTDTYTPPTPLQYSLPTLIIQAINDSNGYYPTAKSVHADLPASQLISVNESGHFIWLGPNTKQWEKQLFAFLKTYGR